MSDDDYIRLIYTSHNALRRQDFRLKWQMQIRQNYQWKLSPTRFL